MLCPNCETENRDAAKFCDECGFPLADAKSAAEQEPSSLDEPASLEIPAILQVPELESLEDDRAGADDSSETGELHTLEIPVVESDIDQQKTQAVSPVEGVDFSGLEVATGVYGESVVDASYQAPALNWRDGNTMQMEPLGEQRAEQSRDYLASSSKKKRLNKKVVAIVCVLAAVVVVAGVFLAFKFNLLGGKVVPDVKGMTVADATSVLEGEGFTVATKQVKSDDTEGLVLITDPETGSHAANGSLVNIHVATARSIPQDILSMNEEQAKAALNAEGFTNVKFVTENSEETKGKVLSVSPEAGTRAKSGTEITVKIATPYTVPDVKDMYLDDAIAAIQEAGLGYDIVYILNDQYNDGTMLGTSPSAGTVVSKGDIVYIQISQSRAKYLEGIVRSTIAPGSTTIVNGTPFVIDSVDSVTYLGNNTVSYTATARAYTSLVGVTVYGSPMTITNTVTFSDDNQIIG